MPKTAIAVNIKKIHTCIFFLFRWTSDHSVFKVSIGKKLFWHVNEIGKPKEISKIFVYLNIDKVKSDIYFNHDTLLFYNSTNYQTSVHKQPALANPALELSIMITSIFSA